VTLIAYAECDGLILIDRLFPFLFPSIILKIFQAIGL
jgi:hypothetical protein